ncbi:MAG: hypothetical protein E6306_04785 [Enterobacter sp.]|nr:MULTISPECIES: hypothetical protein [Enterobacter]MDU7153017.1 hypothetical protein [Enterobacter sp.]
MENRDRSATAEGSLDKNAGLKKYSALASDGDSNPAIAIATGVRDVKENVLKISDVLRFISFPCSKC